MTLQKFKELKTNIKTLEKFHNPTSGKLVFVTINEVKYRQTRKGTDLSRNQLKYFEYIDDFDLDTPINL